MAAYVLESREVGANQQRRRARRASFRPLLERLEERLNPNTSLLLAGTILSIDVDFRETAILTLSASGARSRSPTTPRARW